MDNFTAYRAHDAGGEISSRLETVTLDDLDAGEVVIKASYSDVNYKDALAATGAGRIMKRFPMVVGIDVSGVVAQSSDPRFEEGDPVLAIGSGLGEERDGGYSEYVRLPADLVIPLPSGLSQFEAMAVGTAGFTAALAIQRMEDNGLSPDQGPVLVNGATGGVGSYAIDMLAGRGYRVTAFTGKRDSEAYLRGLGAGDLVFRGETELGQRPLERALWAGAVDSVGGEELAWLTRTVEPLGNIASIGLAGGHTLNTTVMPFILRGVNLLGINSVLIPMSLKQTVVERIASDLRPRHLDDIITRTVALSEVATVFQGYLDGTVTGRTVVNIAGT